MHVNMKCINKIRLHDFTKGTDIKEELPVHDFTVNFLGVLCEHRVVVKQQLIKQKHKQNVTN